MSSAAPASLRRVVVAGVLALGGAGVAAPSVAAADTARATLATFFAIDESAVTSATGFRLEGAGHYTDMIMGAYMNGGHEQRVIALMRCDARECRAERVWLGNQEARLLGMIDLEGTPAPLTGREIVARADWTTAIKGPTKRPRWPALLVETRDDKEAVGSSRFRGEVRGTESHHKLLVISLRKRDARREKVASLATLDRYPSGAGHATSYRLARGKQKGALDIVGTEQRFLENDSACLRPEPVEVYYRLRDGRYQPFDPLLDRRGCH